MPEMTFALVCPRDGCGFAIPLISAYSDDQKTVKISAMEVETQLRAHMDYCEGGTEPTVELSEDVVHPIKATCPKCKYVEKANATVRLTWRQHPAGGMANVRARIVGIDD